MKIQSSPRHTVRFFLTILTLLAAWTAAAAPPPEWRSLGDKNLEAYFAAETAKLESRTLADIKTLEDWEQRKDLYRKQLFEMLGMAPDKERTPLNATVTDRIETKLFSVENLHFQSSPGFYVTGNLYVPTGLAKPAPAILYVCGHGKVKENGVSYGNKTYYQHHGAWFAQNGYVCLTIDTVQLGEIEGVHHGTYREGMWWWNSRGYSSAGAEAWNCIRALDYLQSRPEVDGERLGVTGRSGGGAYSWWIAALDERIKAAVPVAGIADLRNHVVDGCVEGHCDCMFMVNTYRWDYAQVAALVAPRPLLISNTDKDRIFPLDGVVRVHKNVAKIYDLYGASDKLGLLITEGPHKDTQQLRVPAFHWFNRWLKGEEPPITLPAEKLFEPQQLKVFETIPADEITSRIHDTFTPTAPTPAVPKDADDWAFQSQRAQVDLEQKAFRGWPEKPGELNLREAFSAVDKGVKLTAYDFDSQDRVRLRLYVVKPGGLVTPDKILFNVLSAEDWTRWLGAMGFAFKDQLTAELGFAAETDGPSFEQLQKSLLARNNVWIFLAPRGIGLTDWRTGFDDPKTIAKKEIQIRRRHMQIGQTLDGMRVWDIRRGIQAARQVDGLATLPLWLQAKREMAVNALYAGIFERHIERADLWQLPLSHREGPDYLNVLRVLDIPQAAAIAAEHFKVRLYQEDLAGWEYPATVASGLKWPADQFTVSAVR